MHDGLEKNYYLNSNKIIPQYRYYSLINFILATIKNQISLSVLFMYINAKFLSERRKTHKVRVMSFYNTIHRYIYLLIVTYT